ncbi:unnamed protein product [Protopolystoma xenopodis]|uniref:Uncharacterized protein n=1 Tax=Protopolystoma xenopodis TaxID=117903 RepID=A0A448WGY7_9PLAT|nr:unnamed protein product [Protopolystoma xenopodis]
MDGYFAVWQHLNEDPENFLSLMNKTDGKKKYTVDLKKEGDLPFIDVIVSKEGTGLGKDVNMEPTNANFYLKIFSCHTYGVKFVVMTSVIRSLHLADDEHRDQELRILVENGYPQEGWREIGIWGKIKG